jgi:hypothetical protein
MAVRGCSGIGEEHLMVSVTSRLIRLVFTPTVQLQHHRTGYCALQRGTRLSRLLLL